MARDREAERRAALAAQEVFPAWLMRRPARDRRHYMAGIEDVFGSELAKLVRWRRTEAEATRGAGAGTGAAGRREVRWLDAAMRGMGAPLGWEELG